MFSAVVCICWRHGLHESELGIVVVVLYDKVSYGSTGVYTEALLNEKEIRIESTSLSKVIWKGQRHR